MQAIYYDPFIPLGGAPKYDMRMMDAWRIRFRTRFKIMKETEGLTQEKLADKVGVIQPTIAHWLSGTRTPEDDDQFNRLAEALGMHPAELRYGITPMPEDVRQREEEWRRLSPANQAAMRAAIRALVHSSDNGANESR